MQINWFSIYNLTLINVISHFSCNSSRNSFVLSYHFLDLQPIRKFGLLHHILIGVMDEQRFTNFESNIFLVAECLIYIHHYH